MEKWIVDLTEYDGETWYEEDVFNTREEAIREGRKLAVKNGNEKSFRIGIKKSIDVPCIDAEDILEDMSQQVYYKVGEVAEDYLWHIEKEQIEELEDQLNAVFHRWMKKHKHEPDYYLIEKEGIIYLDK